MVGACEAFLALKRLKCMPSLYSIHQFKIFFRAQTNKSDALAFMDAIFGNISYRESK